MAGWIKLEIGFIDKPEIAILAKKLGVSYSEAAVSVIRVLIWADANVSDGCVPFLSPSDLDTLSRCLQGTCEALASPEIGWLSVDGGKLSFSNWDRHNGTSAKTRALDTDKKRRNRSQSGKCPPNCPDPNGTKTGPEKRREDNKNNTLPADQSGDDLTFLGPSDDFKRWWACLPAGMQSGQTACWNEWPGVLVQIQTIQPGSEADAIEYLIERTKLFAKSPRGKNEKFRWSPLNFLKEGHFNDNEEAWNYVDESKRVRKGSKKPAESGSPEDDIGEFFDRTTKGLASASTA